MKRLIASLMMIAALLLPAGCGRPPEQTVCLVDVSKSITDEGFQAEFEAVDGIVDQMRRGDRMTLVPITGNAMSETPGHVLTFAAPTSRQPYDFDLAKFRSDAHLRIAKLREEFADRPAKRTDILGALAIAREELASGAGGVHGFHRR